jgi:hypothetical protein
MGVMTEDSATVSRSATRTGTVRRELSQQECNRATLARQLLLDRAELSAYAAIERLVGLQAQAPLAPYVGLWSRLADWQPEELADLLANRRVVRTGLMRATIHLMTARDSAALRPLIERVRLQAFRGSEFARQIADVPLDQLLEFGAGLLAETPMTLGELKPLLAERWPGRDPTALGYAVAFGAPLVQVTPRGVWGATGPARLTTERAWLGAAADVPPSTLDELVLRYLAAFGPATVKDIQQWSGLSRLAEVVAGLRGRLVEFTDDRGAILYDLPDAPRPAADTPAPPRFLPEYDNVLLSHADRRRVIPDGRRVPLPPGNGAAIGTVLVQGVFSAVWRITRERAGPATLTVTPFARLSDADALDVIDEGTRLLSFVAGPPGSHQVLLAY